MDMQIIVVETEHGWELGYSFNGGPVACGPEEESEVYSTKQAAIIAADDEIAKTRAWDRAGLADAPHTDNF